jgi:hypothetical protein
MQAWLVRSGDAMGRGRFGGAGRCPDDRPAHVRPDAHGDHVLRHHLAGAHPGIVALRDDVRETVIDDDSDCDIGIVRQTASATQARGLP